MKRFINTLSLGLILSLGFVFAHSNFESSVPEDGAVLDTAPTEVVINFEKDIQPGFSIFKVYPLPADMIAEVTTMSEDGHGDSHSEGDSHDSSETHSEGESHSEGDTHSESETQASTEGDHAHSESEAHGESSEHGAMDAAAKIFIPTVIDLSGDEDARADTGLATTEAIAKSVTINLKENLAPGAYVAMFRALSADTHTVEGFITFEIAGE